MPKPPIIPALDWKKIFASAKTFDDWIQEGEKPENREKMVERRRSLELDDALANRLAAVGRDANVLVIAEDWCPDVVRHVPCLVKLADACGKVHVRFLDRERGADVLERFLTVGGEAIPKFVVLNDDFVECGEWGPMEREGRRLIARGKACGDLKAARKKVFERYENDPECREAFEELIELVETASCTAP